MSTLFDLCTRASYRLGADAVQDFNEATIEAQTFSAIYEQMKLSELTGYYWNFNVFVYLLNQEAGTPLDKMWKYKYLPPPNMLRYVAMLDSGGWEVDYEDRSGRIFSNTLPLYAKYHRDLGEADFPPFFQDLLAARLAAEGCEKIVGDSGLQQMLWQEYFAKRGEARKVDSQNNPPQAMITQRNSTWLHARRGGAGYTFGNV